jgi:hypothetical protein
LKDIDFRTTAPPFFSKIISPQDAVNIFGGVWDDYVFWQPYLCGVCCVKMVGDTAGITNHTPLLSIVHEFVRTGAFVILEDGSVDGAFHYPMASVIEDLGLHAEVVRRLPASKVAYFVERGSAVILSCDLAKMTDGRESGGHLVLVYGYDVDREIFLIHDSLEILGDKGCAAEVNATELERISNSKGITVG